MQFPRPRGATLVLLIAVGFVWLTTAIAIQWGGASGDFLKLLVVSTSRLVHVETFFTSLFVNAPTIGAIIAPLLCIYFFGPALEDRWGWKKMIAFFFATGIFGFVTQLIVGAFIPQLRTSVMFGTLGVADAMVIAWALQARPDSKVLLMMVLPVSPMMIIAFTVGLNILKLITIEGGTEGIATCFGSMGMAWALSDRSPLRKVWLEVRLKRIQAETEALRKQRSTKARAASAGFRVIHGEGDDPPRDKRFLN